MYYPGDLVRLTKTTAKGRVGRIIAQESILVRGQPYTGYSLDSDSPGDPLWSDDYLERIEPPPPTPGRPR